MLPDPLPDFLPDNALLRQIADTLPLRIAYFGADRLCRFANCLYCEHARVSKDAIVGSAWQAPGGANAVQFERFVAEALGGRPATFELDEWIDYERRTFEHRLMPDLDGAGAVRGFLATALDVTERAAAQRALQRQGATLASVTEAVPDVIMAVDAQSRLCFVNGAFEAWRGVSRAQALGRSLNEVLGDEEFLRVRAWARRAIAGETVRFDRDDLRDGGTAHLAHTYIPLRLEDGRVDGFVGVVQDITAHRREQVRLAQLAHRDPLTGLLNRAGFEMCLQDLLRSREGHEIALLYIDLDHFKPVNDRHGHPVGDQLLQLVAQRFERLVRPTDAVARLGGDEFAVALGHMHDPEHAVAVAEKIVAAAQTPFELASLTLQIGASVGLAYGHGDVHAIVAQADAALYDAKRAGRGIARVAPRASAGTGLADREAMRD